jgi:hypothetical protein
LDRLLVRISYRNEGDPLYFEEERKRRRRDAE